MAGEGKPCLYEMAWVGRCKNPTLERRGVCDKHVDDRCWCGGQAVRECGIAMTFVCGARLCGEHECRNVAAGLTASPGVPHSEKGLQQWKDFAGPQRLLIEEQRKELGSLRVQVQHLKDKLAFSEETVVELTTRQGGR